MVGQQPSAAMSAAAPVAPVGDAAHDAAIAPVEVVPIQPAH